MADAAVPPSLAQQCGCLGCSSALPLLQALGGHHAGGYEVVTRTSTPLQPALAHQGPEQPWGSQAWGEQTVYSPGSSGEGREGVRPRRRQAVWPGRHWGLLGAA